MNKNNGVARLLPALLIVILLAAVYYVNRDLFSAVKTPAELRDVIRNQRHGALFYIMIQVVQVVVAVIPGEPIQLAGGFVFGVWLGFIYAVLGIMMGSAIAFFIARKLGFQVVRYFVSEARLLAIKQKIESRRGLMGLFLLCLIPGIPKDLIVYAVGLTPIKFRTFFPLFFIARLPAMLVASFIGAQMTNLG